MSSWICCNSCFLFPSDERKLAVTTCYHVICNVCYNKGKKGICLICSAKCGVSPLSDKSSSEVKAFFSDVSAVAAKHCKEIGKVHLFQAGHQKRLYNYYQQSSEKQKDTFVKMKQEMQHMSKKLNEQSAYITKLDNSLHCHSANPSSVAQVSHSSHNPHGRNSVPQISKFSPPSISRHSSMSNVTEIVDVSERSLFRRPSTLPKVPSFGATQTGQMGSIPLRLSSQNSLASHSGLSASISQTSRWQIPIFKPSSSVSSLH